MSCLNSESLEFLLSKSTTFYKECKQGGEKIVTFADGEKYKIATNNAFMIAVPFSNASTDSCYGNIPETLLNFFESSFEDISSKKQKIFFNYEKIKTHITDEKNFLIQVSDTFYNGELFSKIISLFPAFEVYQDNYGEVKALFVKSDFGSAMLLPLRPKTELECICSIDDIKLFSAKHSHVPSPEQPKTTNNKTTEPKILKALFGTHLVFWISEIIYIISFFAVIYSEIIWDDITPVLLSISLWPNVISYIALMILFKKSYKENLLKHTSFIVLLCMSPLILIHTIQIGEFLTGSVDFTFALMKFVAGLLAIGLLVGIICLFVLATSTKKSGKSIDANGNIKCPSCGSYHIVTMARGYHWFWGIYGSGNPVNVCQACGRRFEPGE